MIHVEHSKQSAIQDSCVVLDGVFIDDGCIFVPFCLIEVLMASPFAWWPEMSTLFLPCFQDHVVSRYLL